MTLAISAASGTKKAANLRVRTASGVKGAANGYIRTVNGLNRFFSKFAVSVAPPNANAGYNSSGAAAITTKPVTVTVTGGVGTIAYAWTQLTGGAWTIDQPAAATTTFTIALGPGESDSGTFQCVVTDQGGHSQTVTVGANAANRYGGTL